MTAFVSRRHASDLQLHESHSNDENLHFLQGTGHPKAIKKSLKTQILASFFRPFFDDFYADDTNGVPKIEQAILVVIVEYVRCVCNHE